MTESNNKPRPRWWRFQFSLRTFLIGSTLASVGIWWSVSWYKRPGPEETKIPGGMSIWVEREVEQQDQWGQPVLVRGGFFAVTDEHGRVWCRGRFKDGEPTGNWTWFGENGGTALSGKCQGNARRGSWMAWNSWGKKTLDVQHGDPKEADLARFQLGGSTGLWSRSPRGRHLKNPVKISNRSGPATVHHSNARLSEQGSYENDCREGKWTFCDERGHKTAEGAYREGRRHGKWLVFDESGGEPRSVYYVNGVEEPDLPAKVAELTRRLDSKDWQVRADAIDALGALGVEAVPALQTAIGGNDPEMVVRALQALALMGPEANEAAGDVRRIAEAGRVGSAQLELVGKAHPTNAEAMLTLFAIDESAREETLGKLLVLADLRDDEACRVLHLRIAQLGALALPLLGRALDSHDVDTRLAALDVLVCMIWPANDYAWQSSPLPQEYRGELRRIMERAQGNSDPAISKSAREFMQRIRNPVIWGPWPRYRPRPIPFSGPIPVVG